ncbi:MAG: 3'(2'),5'-bisphosphate nucleotidase CysQ [Magnetococcales bacterium]|nr:3'(2'),5'-bisphosphate nucleotidase CysQ [Magnetococcales bacterium]MBF0439513.1 3'(2'),5'-bisphosphate nucleotidase CysQ [Magnetococcales bacterium]
MKSTFAQDKVTIMTAKSSPLDLMTSLDIMVQAAHEAGEAIMAYYKPGETVGPSAEVREKGANNPLTKADLEADALLRQRLLTSHPHCGWLSEETVDDPKRLQHHWVWVVDPMDGTKEFILGIPQFAISVALVEAGQPVAACIYNPATQETFTAIAKGGAQLNGQPLQASQSQSLAGASCLASRSETQRGDWESFLTEWHVTTMGSIAYKLALVASGRFDMTFTLTPKNEWDFCAGDLLVHEAGGRVTHKNGTRFQYNRAESRVRAVLATNGHLHESLLDRLITIPYSPDRH